MSDTNITVLVTGASGLVGQVLCSTLGQAGHSVTRAVRKSTTPGELAVGSIDGQTSWDLALAKPIDGVVHLAACVHMMNDTAEDPSLIYRQVNTDGTLHLALQCAASGVKRFVFISTVKVMGEGCDHAYQVADSPHPIGPYAISKWHAEQGLHEIAASTGMEVVILRPPLVYGPGVGANFFSLLKAVKRGVPLPLGSIDNRRSLIYLGNLVDAISTCLLHPMAAGKTYLVSDGEDISTPELVRRIADAFGRSPRLFPVPEPWLRFTGKLFGKGEAVERLLGSLVVDNSPILSSLDWTPPYTLQAGLKATAEWYVRNERSRKKAEKSL